MSKQQRIELVENIIDLVPTLQFLIDSEDLQCSDLSQYILSLLSSQE